MTISNFVSGLAVLGMFFLMGCSRSQPDPQQPPAVETTRTDHPAVEIKKSGSDYLLYRHGVPFWVQGASGTGSLELLKAAGGNAVRTYVTEGLDSLLNKADSVGIAVMVGIWLQKEEEGFDYFDPEHLRAQREHIIRVVGKHKDHPALLCWGLGNEVIEYSKNAKTIAKVIGELADLVHQMDPQHPVTTSCVIGDVELLLKQAPQLDFISVNSFGALEGTSKILTSEIESPFLITEWGTDGYWESPKTPWNSPVEYTSYWKGELLRNRYQNIKRAKALNCLGSFVFYWGQKQEMTHTWYSLLMGDGAKTPEVDVLNELWEGAAFKDLSPRIHKLYLEGEPQRVFINDTLKIIAETVDPENQELTYQWEITKDGRRFRYVPYREEIRPEPIQGLFISQSGNELVFRVPPEKGTYRIFVSAYDPSGNGTSSNLAILVENSSLIY